MFKFCNNPWTTVYISNDTDPDLNKRPGDVGMCLCQNWHNSPSLGNLFDKPLSEIYQDVQATMFRETIKDQTFGYCNTHTCPKYWTMYDVPSIDQEADRIKKSLPTNLSVSIDFNCNLSCASCRNTKTFSTEINESAWNILAKLTEAYKDFQEPTTLSIDGSGDLFTSATWRKYLLSDNIPDCFRFRITTNGNLITKNLDLIENIKDKISEVTVSLDAGTAETYKEVRGGNFNLVLDGIKALVSMGNIKVGTEFVLQKKNYKEVLLYRDLSRELKTNWIGLSQLVRWAHMSDEWWEQNNFEDNKSIDYELLYSLLREFSKTENSLMTGGLLKLIQ